MNKKALTFAVISIIGWSSSFAGISAALKGGFSPGGLILFRLSIASLIFIIYGLLPTTKFSLPERRDLLLIISGGIIGITFYHIGLTFGQQYITPGTSSMIVGSGPVFTTIIAVLFLGERLKWYGWIGLFIGFGGIVLITIGTGDLAFHFIKGILPILIATISVSVFFVLQKPLLLKYKAIELTAYFTWFATIPLFIYLPDLVRDIQTTTVEANIAAIFVGVVPAGICYATWAIATSHGDISKISTLLYLEPPLAILIAFIWLAELPSFLSMVGGFITIASVAVVNWIDFRKNRLQKRALQT